MPEPQSTPVSIKKNTFFNIVRTFSTTVFPLITFPYVSRTLHAENIGKVNFSTSIVGYFNLLATLGIGVYAVRECSKVKDDKESLSSLASQIFSMNLATMIISLVLLAGCLVFVPSLGRYRLLIAIQSLTIIFGVLGADWINTAMEDFRFITIRTFVFQLVSLSMLFAFVHSENHYIIYAIIGVISASGANIVNIFYRRRYCRIRPIFQIDWKKHFPPVLMLFAMLVAQSILNNLDITMLGLMNGDKDVGLYSTAMKIISIVTQVVASITWVVMPQLSYNFAHDDYDGVNKILHSVMAFTFSLGLPCLVGINFLAPEIIMLVGGEEYLGAVACCRILTVNMGFGFISNIYGNMILLPTNKEKQFTIACLVGMIFNIISNAMLIPRFGIEGASIATVVSGLVIVMLSVFFAGKNARFGSARQILLAPIVGCIMIILVCISVKVFIQSYISRIVIAVICSIIVYCIVLVLMRNELMHTVIAVFKNRLKK